MGVSAHEDMVLIMLFSSVHKAAAQVSGSVIAQMRLYYLVARKHSLSGTGVVQLAALFMGSAGNADHVTKPQLMRYLASK